MLKGEQMKLTNLEFLKKHRYSIKGMDEEGAKAFIIKQSKECCAYKYMIARAKQIMRKKG